MLSVGSLFSGIGGFDLGFERAGMRTAWFCERDEFCRRVLECRWPGVPCYPDVARLRGCDVEPVDVLCGGFPCQDISLAGNGGGLDGARSGLWFEMARIVRELEPRWVVVENVAALRSRGLDRVLRDLAACGYDAEWDCIPASAVGAPHQRDRLWLVAYPARDGEEGPTAPSGPVGQRARPGGSACGEGAAGLAAGGAGAWVEPDVGRVADGVPDRVDRLAALGNALVPQIAEWIGRRIVSYELASSESEAA